jgi:hypothetical protein
VAPGVELAGDGQAGEHVSAGAAARDHKIHPQPERWLTLISSPEAHRAQTIEDPP